MSCEAVEEEILLVHTKLHVEPGENRAESSSGSAPRSDCASASRNSLRASCSRGTSTGAPRTVCWLATSTISRNRRKLVAVPLAVPSRCDSTKTSRPSRPIRSTITMASSTSAVSVSPSLNCASRPAVSSTRAARHSAIKLLGNGSAECLDVTQASIRVDVVVIHSYQPHGERRPKIAEPDEIVNGIAIPDNCCVALVEAQCKSKLDH